MRKSLLESINHGGSYSLQNQENRVRLGLAARSARFTGFIRKSFSSKNIYMKGTFILVVGPSGSGKSVLLTHLHHTMPDVVFPVSCTTRAMRPGETEGKIYHFISEAEFDEKLAHDEFLEWAPYGGYRYGTLKSEILAPLERGAIVIRDVETHGAHRLKELLQSDIVKTIFIDAGDWETMKRRILSRAPMTDVDLESRRIRHERESAFKAEADAIVPNLDGKLEEAKKNFVETVKRLAGK